MTETESSISHVYELLSKNIQEVGRVITNRHMRRGFDLRVFGLKSIPNIGTIVKSKIRMTFDEFLVFFLAVSNRVNQKYRQKSYLFWTFQ